MVEHCENCNCANVKKYCGMEKFFYIKLLLMCGIPIFIGISVLVFYVIKLQCSSRWSQPEYVVFAVLYSCFVICYMMMVQVTKPLEYTGLFFHWLFTYMWEVICNIWNLLTWPTWSDTRLILSMRRAIARNQSKREISISDNESNGEMPPPLPPKKRKRIEADKTTVFQKFTSKVSQGTSSSTALEDEPEDSSSSLSHSPHYSKHSAPSAELAGRRGKKLSKRGQFKNMMSKVTKQKAINEEGLDTQGASGVELSISSLNQNSASDSVTEQETSFITKSHQSASKEQDIGYVNVHEKEEPEPTRRIHGVHAQPKRPSTGDKQNYPDQTSGSRSRSIKKQSSAVPYSLRENPEPPSTSGFFPGVIPWDPTYSPQNLAVINAPILKFGARHKFVDVPLSTLENTTQEQSFADVYSGCQGKVKKSGTECKSSESYIRLPESESQSSVHDMGGTEGNEKTFHQPPASAELQDSLSQTQDQSSEVTGSLEQSQLSDIQKNQGNPDQAVANYVKLPQLEKQLRVSDIRTEMKQTSPEQSAIRNVQTSLQGQVSSMPGIQRMQTYHGQTSSAGPQRQGRISDVQRRRSRRKHTPIPMYRTSSQSESESPEEKLNLQQPIQSSAQFSSAMSQIQTSGIGKSSTQEIGVQERTLQEETSVPRTLRTCKTLEKLRNLQHASEVGFSEATSQARHIGGGHKQPLSADYARKRFRGKAERATTQKRGESLSIESESPFQEWDTRTKRTQGSTESTSQISACTKWGQENTSIQSLQVKTSGGGYLPHSILSRSEGNPIQADVAITPLNRRNEGDNRIKLQPLRDPSHLKEKDKQETQREETFFTLDRATGGLVLSRNGAEEGETEAVSSKQSIRYDPSMNVLDLSHIKVSIPLKYINLSIDKGESQNSERPIRKSSIKTKRTEGSAESTSQLSACDRRRLVSSTIQRQQIETSAGGYIEYSTLSVSEDSPIQTHLAATPISIRKEGEDPIGQQSRDPSQLKEMDEQETQRKETFLSLDLVTGGLVLSKDGAEGESEAHSSEQSFMFDQSINVLDLAHIEVDYSSPKDVKTSKDKDGRQK